MKTYSRIALALSPLLFLLSPVLASATGACPSGLTEDNGQCYAVDVNGTYTLVSGVLPANSSTVTGSGTAGAYCESSKTCAQGYFCQGDPTGTGTCQPIPQGTPLPTGSGSVSPVQKNNSSSGSGSGAINTTYLEGYKNSFVNAINGYLVPALMALAFIVFLWGIYKYFIYGASNEHEKGEGRKFAMWGIIGFVIILSLWGIVNLVRDTLNFNQAGSNVPTYPTL